MATRPIQTNQHGGVNEISFYWPPLKISRDSSTPLLLKDEEHRATLVRWIPQTLRHKSIRTVFSTEMNGSSITELYRHCGKISPSLLIIEVAGTNELIGAFCTDPWHLSTTVYGSGECFLFKLFPDKSVYKWKHMERRGSLILNGDIEADDPILCRPEISDAHPFIHPINHRSGHVKTNSDGSLGSQKSARSKGNNSLHRLQDKLPYTSRHRITSQHAAMLAANESSFMFSTPYFMGLGASSTSVSCGLKIHEGLVKGSSGFCATFGNPCLVNEGSSGKVEFDISCVEIYSFC
jgi:hypothetical protein